MSDKYVEVIDGYYCYFSEDYCPMMREVCEDPDGSPCEYLMNKEEIDKLVKEYE